MNKIVLIFCVLLSVGCPPNTDAPVSKASVRIPPKAEFNGSFSQAKNIILMIGDGMGLGQVSAALYMNSNRLNLEHFPVIGLQKTYSGNNLITDSAAAATAIACGVKTYNGAVGMGMDTLAKPSILEQAEKQGFATGMVATSTIVHATPASFIAHQPLRALYENIALEFLNTEIDFFIGGGKKYFDRRTDDRNLIKELRQKDYTVQNYFNIPLNEVMLPRKKNFVYFTADDDPLPVQRGRTYLTAASKMGISFLKNHSEKGFFLMIEGSQIDWGGHANNAEYVVSETLDFDRAIGEVLEFAKRDQNTLVIVTADHETGGLAIVEGSKMDEVKAEFPTGKHTGTLIPVFAYGPGSELFGGIYENTEIYFKMKKAMGLK